MKRKKRVKKGRKWFNSSYKGPERRRGRRILFMLLWVFLYALLFYRFVISSCVVEGVSMDPTLKPGSARLVNRFIYFFKEPQRGDIIVLSKKQVIPFYLIKRIIGIPGDHVQIRGGAVWVNGEKIEEPYAKGKTTPSIHIQKLGEKEYFVLGDNREDSDDSRFWGPAHRTEIVGKVSADGIFSFW